MIFSQMPIQKAAFEVPPLLQPTQNSLKLKTFGEGAKQRPKCWHSAVAELSEIELLTSATAELSSLLPQAQMWQFQRSQLVQKPFRIVIITSEMSLAC